MMRALYKLSYGLYVITCRDGSRDNGMIGNTVMQVAGNPTRIAVGINKENYSHQLIRRSGKLNVNCLTESAPFSLVQTFGFQSGREVDKFAGQRPQRTENGLILLTEHVNACLSLQVEDHLDLGTHGLFLCTVTQDCALSREPSMTYAYYQEKVKPRPRPEAAATASAPSGPKAYVCKVCGWIYEGDTLPRDLVCPLCKHGAEDFAPLL